MSFFLWERLKIGSWLLQTSSLKLNKPALRCDNAEPYCWQHWTIWAAKHCSMLLSMTRNRLLAFCCVVKIWKISHFIFFGSVTPGPYPNGAFWLVPRGPYHTVRTSRVFAPKQVEEWRHFSRLKTIQKLKISWPQIIKKSEIKQCQL